MGTIRTTWLLAQQVEAMTLTESAPLFVTAIAIRRQWEAATTAVQVTVNIARIIISITVKRMVKKTQWKVPQW